MLNHFYLKYFPIQCLFLAASSSNTDYHNTVHYVDGPLFIYFWDLFQVHTRVVEARVLQAGLAKVIHTGKNFYDSSGIRTQDL